MTRPDLQQLDATAASSHQLSLYAGAGGGGLAVAHEYLNDQVVAPGATAMPRAMGGVGAGVGMLGAMEGLDAYRLASARGEVATERGNRRGATATERTAARLEGNNATEDRVNAVATMGNGVMGMGGGVAAMMRYASAAENFGRAGGVIQGAQGVYNLVNAYQNWDTQQDRATQQLSDGILQLGAGVAGMVGGPVGTGAGAGLAIGTMARETADAYAVATGLFGQRNTTTTRGLPTDEHEAEGPNNSATDAAIDIGSEVANRVGGTYVAPDATPAQRREASRHVNGGWATAAGALATVAAAPLTTSVSLLNALGLVTMQRGNDHIVASDQEERHAPLAANDHSRVAEERRRLRRRRDVDARQRAAQFAAQQQQIPAHHRDLMNMNAPANAQFRAINGPDAGSIERDALNWHAAPEFNLLGDP